MPQFLKKVCIQLIHKLIEKTIETLNHDSWYTPLKNHHRFASLQSIGASVKELDFQPICNLEIVHSGRLVP